MLRNVNVKNCKINIFHYFFFAENNNNKRTKKDSIPLLVPLKAVELLKYIFLISNVFFIYFLYYG